MPMRKNGLHTHVAESEESAIIYEMSLAMKFRASAKGIGISRHARSPLPYTVSKAALIVEPWFLPL